MGMFDEIRCNYPTPIQLPTWVEWFQTKDLTCALLRFEITADGRLVELSDEPDDWSDYHADLRFYTSNLVMSNQDGLWVENHTGDQYEHFEFTARFTDGKLSRIRLTKHCREPAKPVGMLKK